MAIKLIYSMDDHYESSSATEELFQEWSADLASFTDFQIEVELTALVKVSGGATGTFRARVGGAIGSPDGVLGASITTTSATWEQKQATLAIANPAALTLIKLSGFVSDIAETAEMRGAVVTIRAVSAVVTAPATSGRMPPGDFDALWGKDIWFDVTATAGADYVVSPAGDWQTVSERECLRQALLRRFLTNPDEWPTLQGYGAGARMYVKGRNRRTERDALGARLRAQALRDPRVVAVEDVKVESSEDALIFTVVVTPKGETQRAQPLVVAAQLGDVGIFLPGAL